MENNYSTSPKYSRGYAEPENEYNSKYDEGRAQSKSTGFADSLENHFYYDRPAVSQDRMNGGYANYDSAKNYTAYDERKDEREVRTAPTRDSGSYAAPNRNSYEREYYDGAEEKIQQNLSTRYAETREKETGYGMSYTGEVDSMPSATTMEYQHQGENLENYHEKGESVDKQYTINTKGKILIAVYALVVVTVFALIILNTRLLKTMNASYALKQTEISRLSKEVDDLHKELNYVSSDEVIEEKAEEKGMIKG